MKEHDNNIGANYHYLLLKQCKQDIIKNMPQIKQLIRDNIDQANAIDLRKDSKQQQTKVFAYLLQSIKTTQWGQKMIRNLSSKILQKSKDLYEFGSQRNYFLIQNFRQTTQYPTSNNQPQSCYNLLPIYKANINKELRRLIWQRILINQPYKRQFFTYDHKVSPYNIIDELSLGIKRLADQEGIKIKENQKDIALRLLDYTVKKWNRIPNNSEQNLTLCVIQLFSHFTPNKMHDIGSIYVGLIQLAQYYFEPEIQARLTNIYLAFQLVDPDTYQILKKDYTGENQRKLQASLNQVFQHFRMTLTCAYFPIHGAQYIIDQLLIKKRNKFDIYIIFVLLFMIMSDDLEDFKSAKVPILEIITPQRTKKSIKIEDVTDSFKVIYENVPAYHVGGSLPETNKLLDQLLRFDAEQEQTNNKTQDNKQGISQEQLKKFVKADKKQILRLGNLIKM